MKGKQGKTMGAIKQYSHRSQINLNDVCRAFGNNWAYWGVPILKLLTKKLIKAREKHPVFARSKDEASAYRLRCTWPLSPVKYVTRAPVTIRTTLKMNIFFIR